MKQRKTQQYVLVPVLLPPREHFAAVDLYWQLVQAPLNHPFVEVTHSSKGPVLRAAAHVVHAGVCTVSASICATAAVIC